MHIIKITTLLAVISGLMLPTFSQDDKTSESGYRIDEPGTITFTVGVKIKGKVEKPQVVIFLPKEKPQYREVNFTHSFREDLLEPLPFEPIEVP